MAVPTVKSLIILLMQLAIFFTIAALSGLMQVQYLYFISTVRCCITVLKLVRIRKTMLMQNFWGQTRCVRDNAKLSADEDSSNFVYQSL